jgi:NAD(P)-dependent dehydrogenase (short-subunit alcohol dehydrogenase family)
MATTNSNSGITEKPVWFITGCSTGFGYELAKYVLERGYRTVVTARKPNELKEFEGQDGALILTLDVTDRSQVEAAIKNAEEEFGCIDVLVNNAGIGYFAAVEESEEVQVRRMFEINFFGLCRLIHVALPGMRKRRKGFIVNFSSIGGLCGFPCVGYYNATKFAVEGLSEALSQEVQPLGIKVMLVEPSGFRTDWAGRSANESKRQIKDYEATAGMNRNQLRAVSGKQPGDPVRAARAVVHAVESANPPHHLLLGNNAFDMAMAKLEELRQEFSAWEAVARGADFPQEEQKQVIDKAVA